MNNILLLLLGGFLVLSRTNNAIGGVVVKKSGWFTPYKISDTGTLRPAMHGDWSGKAGVYRIRDNYKRVIYVGSSTSQLKKTIYRHFQTWTDRQPSNNRQFDRVTYPKTGYQVQFAVCSPTNALRAEKYFIRKLRPEDNRIKYQQLSDNEVERIEKIADKLQEAEIINDVELPW